jgi:uncharacterized membrane protein YpjA
MKEKIKDSIAGLNILTLFSEDIFDRVLENRLLVKIIIIANLAGTAFGFYWYRDLLLSQRFSLWPLIPDSPLSTLFIAFSLILFLYNRSNSFIDALAFVGNLKYGLWTVFVQLYFFQELIATTSIYLYLFITFSHLLMFLQAFLVLSYSDLRLKAGLTAVLWFLVNDFVDYSLGVHATLPVEAEIFSVVSGVAFSLTVVSAVIFLSKLGHLFD